MSEEQHEVPVVTSEQVTEESLERDEPDLPSVDLPEGWVLVHARSEQVVVTNATQGRAQLDPAVLRAEKQINGTLVNAEGQTPEALAAAAEAIEQNVQAFKADPTGAPLPEPPPPPVNAPLGDAEADVYVEEGWPKTVVTNEGTFSEEEWSGRSRADTIVTEDGQSVFAGVGDSVETIDEVKAQIDQDAHSAEAERTADPFSDVETQQVVYDTTNRLDSPGQSAGGTLVIPAEIDSEEAAAQAMQETSHQAEVDRVLAATEAQERDQPVGSTQGPTAEAMADEHQARLEAQEQAVAKAREQGESEDEAARQAREAGAAAVTGETAPDEPDPSEPQPTGPPDEAAPSARKPRARKKS